MIYNKETVKSDGRVLRRSGPRDVQMVQELNKNADQYQMVIDTLKSQIEDLTNKLEQKTTTGFTPEQVDEEINRAIETYLSEFKTKETELTTENNDLKSRLRDLETEIIKLSERLNAKEELIANLNDTIARINTGDGILLDGNKKGDRPEVDEIFIDPLDKDSGKGLEPHLKTESVDSGENVNDKIAKLKRLMGKEE